MGGPVHDVETDVTTDQRTITNPAALHDPTPFGYSHAVSAPGEPVFIGGQYATGAPVPGDFAAQVDLAFDRLRSALEGVGLGYEHVVRLGTFIVDHDLDKLEILGKALHARFGDRLPAQTLSGVASLALPGMLFEVDAVAVRP
jgi:enamine deaminase RidA (YjgF/YER057c/UK114 family)